VLPDFPELKTRLSKLLVARMKSVQKHTTPFANLASVHVWEGNCVKMIRGDGSEDTIDMKHHRVQIQLTDEEIENLSSEDMQRKFDKAAREMARQMSVTGFESLNKTISDAGNVVHYKGALTIDDVFRMYGTVAIDFDENGRPELPTIMCNEAMREQFHCLLSQINSDPDTKRKLAAMLERKKEEWRDREASRRLVG
jgi:hypothetical protein